MTEVTAKGLSDALYVVAVHRKTPTASSLAFCEDVIRELELQNQKKQAGKDELLFRGDETITLNEITAALIHSGTSDDIAKRAARRYVRHALNNREPEWQVGDVVKDKLGRVFVRLSDGNWSRNGSDLTWTHDQPLRPLKQLKEV
jgi:hypothetical protein